MRNTVFINRKICVQANFDGHQTGRQIQPFWVQSKGLHNQYSREEYSNIKLPPVVRPVPKNWFLRHQKHCIKDTYIMWCMAGILSSILHRQKYKRYYLMLFFNVLIFFICCVVKLNTCIAMKVGSTILWSPIWREYSVHELGHKFTGEESPMQCLNILQLDARHSRLYSIHHIIFELFSCKNYQIMIANWVNSDKLKSNCMAMCDFISCATFQM